MKIISILLILFSMTSLISCKQDDSSPKNKKTSSPTAETTGTENENEAGAGTNSPSKPNGKKPPRNGSPPIAPKKPRAIGANLQEKLISIDWCVKGASEDTGQDLVYRFQFFKENKGQTVLRYLDQSRKTEITRFNWEPTSKNKIDLQFESFQTVYAGELTEDNAYFKYSGLKFYPCLIKNFSK